MMRKAVSILLVLVSVTLWGQTAREQWGEAECQRWLNKYGEIRGINCPHPVCSVISEEEAIKRCASLGFNSLRWWPGGSTAAEFITNVDRMATLCAKYGMTVSPVVNPIADYFFRNDDSDASLEKAATFTRTVIKRFKGDDRIILWDLWNEPERNYCAQGTRQMEWIIRLAQEARSVGCTQPLSASIMWETDATCNASSTWNKQRYAAESEMDIHNYHDYSILNHDEAETDMLVKRMLSLGDRPIVCTECLASSAGSTLARTLIHMQQHNIGFYTWGLYVNDCNWEVTWGESTLNAWEPTFHNLLYADGEPMNPDELHWIRDYKWNKGLPNNDPGIALTDVWSKRRAWKLMAGLPVDAQIYDNSGNAVQATEQDGMTGKSIAMTMKLATWNGSATTYYSILDRILKSAEKNHVSVIPVLLTGKDLKYSKQTLLKYVRDVIARYKDDTRIRAWVVVNQSEAGEPNTQLLQDIMQEARRTLSKQPLVMAPYLDATTRTDTLGEDAASLMMRMSDVIGYACSQPLSQQQVTEIQQTWQRPVLQIMGDSITAQNPPMMKPHHQRWTGVEVWQWLQRAPVMGLQCQSVEEALTQMQGRIDQGTALYVNLDMKVLRADTTAYYALMDSMLTTAQGQGLSVLPTLQTDKGQGINVVLLCNTVRKLLTRYGSHPAILAWNLWDRPNHSSQNSAMLANMQKLMDAAREVGPCQPVIVTPSVSANLPSDLDCFEALAHGSKLGNNGWNRLKYGYSNESECYKLWAMSDFVGFTSTQPQRETAWVASVAYKFGRPVMCNWGTATGEPQTLLERTLPNTVSLWYGHLPITDQIESVTPEVPATHHPLYTPQGLRVGNNYRGLVIQGGKKFYKK